MRFQPKYKSLNLQNKNRRIDVPLRILKFKRTKWKSFAFFIQKRRPLSSFLYSNKKLGKLKLKNLKIQLSKVSLKKRHSLCSSAKLRISFNNLKHQVNLKRWERIQSVYKQALLCKRSFYHLHDSNLSYTETKKRLFDSKKISTQKDFLSRISQFDFRIDILLWKLRFFKSTYEARVFINNELVLVNSKLVSGNYFLKKGDVISFKLKLNYGLNLSNLKKYFSEVFFIEFDLYTGTIIILESFEERTNFTNSFLVKQQFKLDLFRYSFR